MKKNYYRIPQALPLLTVPLLKQETIEAQNNQNINIKLQQAKATCNLPVSQNIQNEFPSGNISKDHLLEA